MRACPSDILLSSSPPSLCFSCTCPGRTPRSKAQANWVPTLVSTLGLAPGRSVSTGAIILVGPIVIAGDAVIIGLRAHVHQQL
jgi:hypothetical protein